MDGVLGCAECVVSLVEKLVVMGDHYEFYTKPVQLFPPRKDYLGCLF